MSSFYALQFSHLFFDVKIDSLEQMPIDNFGRPPLMRGSGRKEQIHGCLVSTPSANINIGSEWEIVLELDLYECSTAEFQFKSRRDAPLSGRMLTREWKV